MELAQKELQERAKKELARRHLLDFIKYRFPDYKINWHHKVLADALERVKKGELKRLMVFMPPRHGKSEEVSVNFPAWCYGDNKDLNIIQSSYSGGLAIDFGRQVRNIMASDEYKELFETRLADDSQSKATWSTTGRGNYNAVGVSGATTGKGADIFIIDDPVKNREEAESEVVSESTWSWYKDVALTRLSPDGAVILVMTRWNDKDLASRILEEEGDKWEVISFPAIAENDEKYRKEGEALWADYFTLDKLLEKKSAVGAYTWASLYQQQPISRETQKFKQELFKYREIKDVTDKPSNCFITIDSSLAKTATSDYTGITINWVHEDNSWNLKSYHVRLTSPELIKTIFELQRAYNPIAIGLEETVFTSAIEPFMREKMMQENCFPNVVPLKHNQVNKNLRIESLLPRYTANGIYHIQGMCVDLEEELLRYPASKYDDTMDSCAYQSQIAFKPNSSNNDDDFIEEPEPIYSDIGV